MLKNVLICAIVLLPLGCKDHDGEVTLLNEKIDSVKSALSNTYKPGLGDFMSSIQAHHNKLWFAGKSLNWVLAEFEVHEITEAVENIEKYHADREESRLVGTVKPALDSIGMAIDQKNSFQFNRSYRYLTKACNDCHLATHFEFNVVTIPQTTPFSNQRFSLH